MYFLRNFACAKNNDREMRRLVFFKQGSKKHKKLDLTKLIRMLKYDANMFSISVIS